jgi:hypothetical protein
MARRISVEANTFQNEWLRHHEGRRPLGWMLRESGGLPWVRFHALPDSKRYAETESECQTIIGRANALGIRLLGAGSLCWLVEARADEAEGVGFYAGDYAEDDPDVTWRFYVQPVEWRDGAFDAMLNAIANWETRQLFG